MRDSQQGDAQFFGAFVDFAFDIDGHSTGALVEQGIFRSMVKDTSEAEALLLSAGEDIFPIAFSIQATFPLNDVQ